MNLESRKTVPNHTFLIHDIYINSITFSALLNITWNLMFKLLKLCNKYRTLEIHTNK